MKKKHYDYVLYILLVLVIIGLVFSVSYISSSSQKPAPATTSQGFRSVETGSTDEGDVSVELAPIGVNNGRFSVRISANTHSVDLSQFDLKQIAELEFAGKKLKPVSAPMLSGHHASGLLEFDVDGDVKSFVIRIVGIPKVEKRIFSWN